MQQLKLEELAHACVGVAYTQRMRSCTAARDCSTSMTWNRMMARGV